VFAAPGFFAIGGSILVLLLVGRAANPVERLGPDAHNDGMSERRRVDRVAATGATLALLITVTYIWLMSQLGNRMLAGWAFDTPMPRGYQTYSNDLLLAG
jgi:hypothetical protein